MRFAIASLIFFANVVLSKLVMDTPTARIDQCTPVRIFWMGGTGPYSVSVYPGPALGPPTTGSLGTHTGKSMTWTPNIRSGTSIVFTVKDSTGATATSAAKLIGASTDNACLVHSTDLVLNTPVNVVECETTHVTWSGGLPVYNLNVYPSATPGAHRITSLGMHSGTSTAWNTTVKAGTSVVLQLEDVTGAIVYSAPFVIAAGNSTSCQVP